MPIDIRDLIAGLPEERRTRIEQRAQDLIAEELSLRDLRHALGLTQESLATQLGVRQETISRVERRSDLLLSTLRQHVAAMGGELELVARFPGRPPVTLKGLAPLGVSGGEAARGKRGMPTQGETQE